MVRGKPGSGGARRFRSQRQWRWAFANKMSFADTWAHRTTGTRKAGTKKGSARFRSLPKVSRKRR